MLKEIHEQPRRGGRHAGGRGCSTTATSTRRGRHRRRAAAQHPARLLRRLRHLVPRRPDRGAMDRAARAPAGGGRAGQRGPLPRPGLRPDDDLVVAISQSGETLDTLAAMRPRARPARPCWPLPTSWTARPRARPTACCTRTPVRRSASPRPSAHRAARRHAAARGLPRPRARHARPRTSASAWPRARRGAGPWARCWLADPRRSRRSPRRYARRALLLVPRARHRLPHAPRGRAQAQGDLLHPRRGVRRRRDEARPHRAASTRSSPVVVVAARRPLRQGRVQHGGGAGARRRRHRGGHRGRRDAIEEIAARRAAHAALPTRSWRPC